ncbi:hypothetical protein [Saccharothrix hoggarensis]|uniref:Uncharacterized protein n=1 Tax=Saccharothrix hoggarensis TaxID=913853 RepID=A0ABW3QDW3_9PSEU
MARRRPSILPRGGAWVATYPRVGFTDDVESFEDRERAFEWMAERLPPQRDRAVSISVERSYPLQDGLAAVPRWTPTRHRR